MRIGNIVIWEDTPDGTWSRSSLPLIDIPNTIILILLLAIIAVLLIFVINIANNIINRSYCDCQYSKFQESAIVPQGTYQKELKDVLTGRYGDSWRIEFKDGSTWMGYWTECYTLRIIDGTKLEYTHISTGVTGNRYVYTRKIEDITQISWHLEGEQ